MTARVLLDSLDDVYENCAAVCVRRDARAAHAQHRRFRIQTRQSAVVPSNGLGGWRALFRRRLWVILFSLTVSSQAAMAQSVAFSQWVPTVVPLSRSADVILSVRIVGLPTRVVFELNKNPFPGSQPGTDFDMADNGIGADAVAGDGIYSVTVNPQHFFAGPLQGFFRPFMGFVRVYQGTTLVARLNAFAQVITPQVPQTHIETIAPDVRYTEYVVNIANMQFESVPTSTITRRFYELFPDAFDFLNVVSGDIGFVANAFHFGVRNTVQGIEARTPVGQRLERLSVRRRHTTLADLISGEPHHGVLDSTDRAGWQLQLRADGSAWRN